MIEIMYDIAPGSNYKFNTAFLGEQVHVTRPLPIPFCDTELHPRSLRSLICPAVFCTCPQIEAPSRPTPPVQ